MDASSVIKRSKHKRDFKFKESRGFEFAPTRISEKHNLLDIINLVLEIPPSDIQIMQSSTQKTESTRVGDLSLEEKQDIKIWGFTPNAERLNGRMAMIGFVTALMLEFFSGQGVLQFLNLL